MVPCGARPALDKQERWIITHEFTWSLHEPLLLACQKASAGLDGREQSCMDGRRLDAAWREDRAHESNGSDRKPNKPQT